MELNLKISFDNMNFSVACVDSYIATIKMGIADLENLKCALAAECYSINNIKLLENNKIEIEGTIEDGVTVVDDIFSIVEAVKTEKDILTNILKQCGFHSFDVKLVISKLC